MATRKIIMPRNLPGVKKHFETQRTDIKKKLRCLNKKRVELEMSLAICEDGLEMCDHMYQAFKVEPK